MALDTNIKDYHQKGRDYVIRFDDGSDLVLVPYTKWWNIEGLDSAVLYQNKDLEALATDWPHYQTGSEERGFWTRGKVTQEILADYWDAALKKGNELYETYTAKKMDEATWRDKCWEFWVLTHEGWAVRQSLEKGIYRVFKDNPRRFIDRLE